MPVLHVVAPFHRTPSSKYSDCPFSGKALRLPAMMRPLGYRVVEYANAGSESEADEKVEILPESDFQGQAPQVGMSVRTPFGEEMWRMFGPSLWQAFDAVLTAEITARVRPGDFVVHTFGATHAHLVHELPQAIHVELGVGYQDAPFGAFRVYESDSWRHYHWGAADASGMQYPDKDRSLSWVVPMSFDVSEWPVGRGDGGYALLASRMVPDKGLAVIGRLLADVPDLVVHAVGTPTPELEGLLAGLPAGARDRLVLRGRIVGTARAEVYGKAFCCLMPTLYAEPFGASGVEAMLCGTPLVASDWGAFRANVGARSGTAYGRGGTVCRTAAQFADAVRVERSTERNLVAAYARSRFDMHRAAAQYDEILKEIASLRGNSAPA